MAGRTSYYGGIVLDGLVFHIDSAKQESYAKRGLRYMQNGNNSMFVDFADTSKNPSTQNAQGTIINGATFSNFAPYHLTPYYSTYWHNPVGNLDIILTDTRNTSSVWSTLEHSWDANGDTNDTKGSANGTIVTPVGETFSLSTMTYQSGKVGSGAFTFNGTNFISLPVYTLTFTSDFSASLWFYVPAGLTDSNLISSFDNKGDYTEYNGWSISYNNTTKSINFFIGIKMGAPGNPGSQYYGISLTTGNNVFMLNQWNHVLVTRKSGTRSRIYVNGVLSASDTNIYNPSYNSQPNRAYIGASYYAFSLPFYRAAPSGLKIDVVQTFTSELDSLAAGSLYSMSDLYSSSAFNNNGIGTFYGNIEFDGVDDYVSFSATPDINTTDITVSTWFYVNKFRPSAPNGGTVSMIASRYSNTTSTNGWELAYNNNGVVWFGGREDASTYISVTASLLVKQINMGITANGGWYNAVGIKSGNQWSISVTETNSYRHIDNIAKIYKGITKHLPGYRTIQAGTGTIPFGTNTLTVGKASNSNDYYMNGRLMNLSIYNRALSLAEINQNYDSFNKRIIEVLTNCVDVTIGSQIWTSCNLNVSTYRNGDIIPQVTDTTEWSNLTTGAWCYYDNDPSTEATYGKLYNWHAVNDSRGLSPDGYHIPTDNEVATLSTYLGGDSVAGGKMKEIGLSHWIAPNTAATNESGFTALPAGFRVNSGDFANIGGVTRWWTSTEIDTTDAGSYDLDNTDPNLFRFPYEKNWGHSVRLVKD